MAQKKVSVRQVEADTDVTLAANSDLVVATQKATKAYADTKANDADVVHDTGAETIAGVKTFSSDPLIPDEAYDATAWNGSLEPPTKNAVRDKIETMGGGGGTVDTVVAGNNIDVDATDPANPIVAVETLVLADVSDVTSSAAEVNVLDGIPAGLTATELGYVDGVTSAIQTQLGTKAPLASPTFTGTVTLPVGLTGVIRADTGVVSVDSDVTDIVAAASTTVAGKVELATDAETNTGTDTARAITPSNIEAWTGSAQVITVGTLASGNATAIVDAGSSTAQGKVELATDAETVTGTDTARATTPANITAKMAAPGAIGGTTAAAITGTTITANTGFLPDANDGAYLGQAGTAFSDLFLAEGGVINWDSGDATLTQTGDTLALAGASFQAANIYGSGTTAENLALHPNSADALTGAVQVQGQLELEAGNPTYTSAPNSPLIQPWPGGVTLDYADSGASVLQWTSTVTLVEAPSAFGTATVFANQATFQGGLDLTGVRSFVANPILLADGAAIAVGSATANVGYTASPAFKAHTTASSGITSGSHTGYLSSFSLVAPTGKTVAMDTSIGFNFTNASLTGAGTKTLTTQIGLDIAALSSATTNIGIRNAATTVYTPIAQANITAVTHTIRSDATVVTLVANASYTLTSAPTIVDGVQGQVLTILNIDTADTITLQDQGTLASSNLRLVGVSCALAPRESITLMYNTTIGDWVELSRSGNVT